MTLLVKKNTDLLEEIHRHVAALGGPQAMDVQASDESRSPTSP